MFSFCPCSQVLLVFLMLLLPRQNLGFRLCKDSQYVISKATVIDLTKPSRPILGFNSSSSQTRGSILRPCILVILPISHISSHSPIEFLLEHFPHLVLIVINYQYSLVHIHILKTMPKMKMVHHIDQRGIQCLRPHYALVPLHHPHSTRVPNRHPLRRNTCKPWRPKTITRGTHLTHITIPWLILKHIM